MKLCHSLLITICFYLIALTGANGQQVYTSADYGGPGTQYLYSRHLAGFTTDQIIIGGADITWDVRNLPATTLDVSQIVPKDQVIDALSFSLLCSLGGIHPFSCLSIYNNTQQAWLQTDTQTLIQFNISDLKRFQRKTQQQLLETFFGFTIDLNGSPFTAVVVYHSPDTILQFPVMYGDTLSSHITWNLDLSPTGQNIQYASHQQRTTKVDGWGTLMTPYDTLNGVLRIRSVISRMDTLSTDTLNVPLNVSQIEYTWYDTAYGLPVMIANGLLLDTIETLNTVSYLVDAHCADPTWTVTTDTTVYAADSSGMALVDFTVGQSNADIYSWNFGDGTIDTSTGDISHVFPGPGIYPVVVTGCMTNCLPLNSCTTQTITIEVRDTTSAVQFLDPAYAGIHIYPNPAQTLVSVDVADISSGLKYQLLDVYGRTVGSGILDRGMNEISVADQASGLYFIQLTDGGTGRLYRAERVLVLHGE